MSGKGKAKYLKSKYEYEGSFLNNTPTLLPNEFEVQMRFSKLEEGERKYT